jgi:Protein tyrosine and serine/threonine kinase
VLTISDINHLQMFNHGRLPYNEIKTNADVIKFVSSGKRAALGPRLGKDSRLRRVAALVEDCWNADPEDRPNFRKISQTCRQLVETMVSNSDEESFMTGESSSEEGAHPNDTDAVLIRLQEDNHGVESLYEGDTLKEQLYAERIASSGTSPMHVGGTYAVGRVNYADQGASSAFYARAHRP